MNIEQSQPELVYAWDGPPRLELWAQEVSRHGRSWRQHKLVADHGTPGVVVVGVHNGCLAMVEHWRPATGRSFLEFPRGFGTSGPHRNPAEPDSPAASKAIVADGARELREETGLEGSDFRVLGPVWADSSLLAGPAYVLTAAVESKTANGLADGETDGLLWIPLEDMPGLMAAGRIADGLTLSAYALFSATR
ncbi:NUDIX hydrolase [Arthrobacter sp. zg-Y411]|uniref:NUDIX hydrolase n=1 Tax=Arthrobacter zhangbolii TaxID=2886936 RepID=UPI001D13419F|nr:NUDIX hydrolase [Arthrobacter zhangbolii]MCC3293470.1 NUDIX hydrolase [Arthrobacter zhangbolii]